MKIVLVTDTYSPDVNGVAMTLGRLVTGLRKIGHEVHVIHTAEAGGDAVLLSDLWPRLTSRARRAASPWVVLAARSVSVLSDAVLPAEMARLHAQPLPIRAAACGALPS